MFGSPSTGLAARGVQEQTRTQSREPTQPRHEEHEEFDEWVYALTVDAIGEPETAPRRVPTEALESLPPGPLLASMLAGIDRSTLNGHESVLVLKARERLVSHYQAGSMADAVQIAYSPPGHAGSPAKRTTSPAEFADDEIRAALTLTRRSADRRLGLALDVCERLPRVWELLDRGVIDLSRARVMVDGTFHLEEPDARDVIDRVSERAPRLTTGQLAALIRRLCAETNPDGATSRYEDAVDRRRLVIEQTVDGTGNLYVLDIPISAATAIGRQINGYMISLKNDGDDRLHDQLRADIACDLLLGNVFGSPGSRGKVDIKVDMTTLAGLDEKAGEIVGMGPVVADVARQIADVQQNAEWRLTVADENGRVVHTGITRRRPNRRLSRQIESIHPTCVFPGCRVPAASCDLDHVVAWSDGGPTNVSNLSPKCRHDHRLKDHGWTQHQDAGDHIWSSPLGHTYIVSGQSP